MSVEINIEGVQGFTYRTKVATSTSVQKLRQRFCRELSLIPESCTLMRSSSNHVAQAAHAFGPEDAVEPGYRLTASVDITLAFHTWNCVRKHNIWIALFGVICRNMHDDITFEQFTSTFMQLSPLERITADTASTSHVKIVLAQYVRLLGADEEPSPLPPPTEALLKAILGTVATGAYVERLLSAALVLKVYSVLASVKYPCEKLELAQQGLTDIVSSLVLLCMEHCSRQQTENAEMSVDQAIMLVAEATLPVIRHRVSFKSTSEHAGDSCLHLLVYLLDKRQQVAKQLAPMLVAQGIWPPVVAALEMKKARSAALWALELIRALLMTGGLDQLQIQEAYTLLFRMQAHHRLCNFFCPAFQMAAKKYKDIQGRAVFDPDWVPDKDWPPDSSGRPLIYTAAGLARSILEHGHVLSNNGQRVASTPNSAQWTAISAAASKALVAFHWFRHHPDRSRKTDRHGVEDLDATLLQVAQLLLVDHLLNPELDVQQVLRFVTTAVLFDRYPANVGRNAQPLVAAALNRFGHDSRHLALGPSAQQTHPGGWVCAGCNECCDHDWRWKTELTITLFCYSVPDPEKGHSPHAAGLVVKALYAALDCPQQCQHLLLGTQRSKVPASGDPDGISVDAIVKTFDRTDESQLTAQLNAIACAARLCEMESMHAPEWTAPGAPSPTPWHDFAKSHSTFEYAMGSFMLAFKAPMPWSTDRCVALTRALHNCHILQGPPPMEPCMYPKEGPQLLKHFIIVLKQFDKVTDIEPLRLQLLTACVQFLQRAMSAPEAISSKKSLWALPELMIGMLDFMPAIDQPVQASQSPGYPNYGMPESSGRLWHLRSAWLQDIMYMLMDTGMHEELFGERAYTTVRSWFLQLVLGSPTGTVPGRSAFEDEALDKPLVETSPYLVMLSKASSEGFQVLDHKTPEPDMYSARAMVRCLYYLIKRLVWLQKTIRSAQLNLAGSRRAAAKKTFQGSQITVPHDIAVAADLAEGKIGNARDMLERTLWCLETLKQGGAWTILLYTVVADWSWAASPQQKDDLRNHLTVDKAMLQSHLQRLERFFPNSPVVVVHSGNFEAPPPPNVTAIEQLLAKEERENAKAAAKKAKKQKQKAKKQQQQQQLDEEAEDRKRLLEQEEEDRLQEQEQQSHIPSSQHTSEQEQPQMSRQHQSQQQQSPGQPDQQEGERRQHGGQQQLGSADQVTASVGDLSIGEMSGPADSPQDNFGKSRVSEHASGTAENQDPPQLQAESSNGEDFLQELFCCPLTKGLMRDPVIAADGHSYERVALETWFAAHDTSPVTGQPLQHKRIVDNVLIRNAIGRHKEQEMQSSTHEQLRQCF